MHTRMHHRPPHSAPPLLLGASPRHSHHPLLSADLNLDSYSSSLSATPRPPAVITACDPASETEALLSPPAFLQLPACSKSCCPGQAPGPSWTVIHCSAARSKYPKCYSCHLPLFSKPPAATSGHRKHPTFWSKPCTAHTFPAT